MGLRSEIVRRLGRSLVTACIPAAALTGCATFAGVSKDLRELTAVVTPNPATNVVCTWQNRLASLPDPTRNGSPIPGIAGQIFLHDAGSLPAEAIGELTVVVSDASPRPQGQGGPAAEVWHFSNSTLKNLRLVDERLGRCYVVFLPWPSTWRDVTRVRFQARYDQPNQPTLYAQETLVTLDFTPTPGGVIPGMSGGGSIPNPADFVKQARVAQAAGRNLQANGMSTPVTPQPQASWGPSPTTPGTAQPQAVWGPVPNVPMGTPPATAVPGTRPVGTYPPTGGVMQPASFPPTSGTMPSAAGYPPAAGAVQTTTAGYAPAGGAVQPTAVPYRPPGTELAYPGPHEVRLFQ